jgi:hypothetical protein
MGFNDEYAKLRKKRQQDFGASAKAREAEQAATKLKERSAASMALRDIAPVKDTKKTDERTWFQKGAFEDGYQFGDVTKSLYQSAKDAETNVLAGILGIGEGVVDAGAYLVGGAAKLFGADEFAEGTKEFIANDLYDEKKVAEALLFGTQALGQSISKGQGVGDALGEITGNVGEQSFFGDKTDSVIQSAGQLAGTAALQAAGVPWWVTTGVTSFGGEVDNAFDQGATYGEAGGSALISAGAEILTEKLSGGIKFGGKTLGDAWVQPLVDKISNKVVRTAVNLGLDALGEGGEEVISQIFSNLGSALYREEDLGEILASEEALDAYLESFIGGAALGGGMGSFNAVSSAIHGRDYKTGLTSNEQKVLDKEIADRIAEAEQGGKKLKGKEKAKIEEEALSDLKKGYISTDTIESALGGEGYKAYQDAIAKDNEAIDKLKGIYTGAELDEAIKGITENSKQGELKAQASKEIADILAKGKDSYLSESYSEIERRKQAFTADTKKYTGKQQEIIQKAIDSGILNNTNRTHEFVDMIAKISADRGISFDFTNNTKLAESGFAIEGKTINGLKTENGIFLNVESKKAINTVVGHEITHVLEGTEFYGELKELIHDYATHKGEYNDRLTAAHKLYKDIDGYKGAEGLEAIEREVTADLVGEYLFTDADFVKKLTSNRNIFQKLWDEIKYLCKIAGKGSKEAKELAKVQHAFEQAYNEYNGKTPKTEVKTKATDAPEDIETTEAEDIENAEVIDEEVAEEAADEVTEEIDEEIDEEMPEAPLPGEAPPPETVEAPLPEDTDTNGYKLTDAQKEALKDSKVRDESGKIKVVYTGLENGSTTRGTSFGSRFALLGVNTYSDSKTATETASRRGSVYERHLNLTNPMDTSAQADAEAWKKAFPEVTFPESGTNIQFWNAAEKHYDTTDRKKFAKLARTALQSMGYDGITYRAAGKEAHQIYVAFEHASEHKVVDKAAQAETKAQFSLSSMANTFFGDENMSANEFMRLDYKQTQGYQDYVSQCVANMKQTRADLDEVTARRDIKDAIDGIVQVAIAAKKAGYDIADDSRRRNQRDSKNRLLFSSLEPNSDYFTSNDISTECDKRKNFADIYDAIVKKEEALGVPQGKRFFDNVDNYFYLHKVLADKGLTQPCRQCYVESMRKNLAPMANAFLKLVKETDAGNKQNDQLYQQSGKNKGELKANNAKIRERMLELFAEYGMTADDLSVEKLTTEDGLAELKITAPMIYEAFNSFYGQSKPKMPRKATPFRFGELTALLTDNNGKIKQSLVDKINATGGFRLQSYSDFQIENYTDTLQVIFEAGTLGLRGHAYTKVPAFIDATAGTNLKRNISIFMYKDGGEWKLDRNDSFPYSLEEIYDIVKADESGNTGIIAVSQNDDMSAWIMANDLVGYGIPFHKSGLKMGTVRDTDVKTEDGRIVKGYSGTKDHTKQQTEVWAKATADHKALTKVKNGINIYEFWDFDNAEGLSKNELIEKNVTAYIDACEDAGYLPKFRDYVMNNGKVLNNVLEYSKKLGFAPQDATIEDISFEYKGYTIPYGYYKFLGDFGMFAPDGTASPHEVLSLKNYDFDKAVKVFSDAETLRRNEILQQFANGAEREYYRNSGLTAEELTEIVKQKRGEVVDSIVAPVAMSLSENGETPKRQGRFNTYGEDVRLEAPTPEDIAPTAETVDKTVAPTPKAVYDEGAPVTEEEVNAMQGDIDSFTDADVPDELDAPFYGDEEVTAADPFEKRDIKEVGNRKVKAYMYENPEVKPFFQAEANVMLGELQRSTKGERFYNDELYYETNGEKGFFGTERETSGDIEYLLDELHYTYAQIEKGLKAIIEDNGAENYAVPKRIEFLLNDRLLKGTTDFITGEEIPPNQDYIKLLNEKQILEYSEEARKKFFEQADELAPMPEAKKDNAPVSREVFKKRADEVYGKIKGLSSGKYHKVDGYGFHLARGSKDAHATITINTPDGKKLQNKIPDGKYWKNEKLWREAARMVAEKDFPNVEKITPEEAKKAQIIINDTETPRPKRSIITQARTHLLDKFSVFEDLALKTKNRELDAKANFMHYSEQRAQNFIANGADGVRGILDLKTEVEKSGLDQEFQEYMYDMLNTDRMSIEANAAEVIKRLGGKFEKLRPEQIHKIAAKKIGGKTSEQTAQTIRDAREYVKALEAKNLPVYGYEYTAEMSRASAAEAEANHPEFKKWAQEIYDNVKYLREQLVKDGEISKETADLWEKIYPHYVPVRRKGKDGNAISVPLDTNKTGVNAPIKRATGGDSDIGDLFKTLALRAEQTFKAGAKNSFGVELMHTLGTRIDQPQIKTNVDEIIDGVETANHESRLKKGENGMKPTFTVFENGERVEFEITEDMYDALKPTEDILARDIPGFSHIGKFQRNILTQYNPAFTATNAIKDVQDILMNSQHAAKTYANLPSAVWQLARKGKWYTEYMQNGGEQNTYFDSQDRIFKEENNRFKKIVGMPLRWIERANNFVERAPRLAEYMASRKKGASVEVAMLDAARVTTNFAAGGDVTKFANRNGATFLNASVQGFNQQVRNIREAKANGLKGWAQLAAKTALAGLPALLLNNLLWDDDEEYDELSDYVKENYYVVAKYGDGQFVRIPKGRTVAVIQNAFEQITNAATGDDEVDLGRFLELAISNLAPNNPIDNNILSPIIQTANNRTWYGEDLVPTRLQDLPDAEQFDESTDAFSKWLGEKTGVLSPYKINYLLNQYGGGIADVFLPMGTPEAERGDNSFLGNLIAPMKDKFTTDGVMNNQNVTDFYSTVDELTKNANSAYATDEDILKYKYMNSVNASLSELYQQKREIQNRKIDVDFTHKDKYEQAREIQRQIDEMTKNGLNTYNDVKIDGGYATVGDVHFRWYEPSADSDAEPGWQKISGKQLEKQEEVTNGLGISASEYWSNKEEYDFAYEYPAKYSLSKAVGGYEAYRGYTSELYDIKADKDASGKSISGSRKKKVIDYINNMDADYGEKIILFKSEYNADNTYNADIVEYLNSRQDISREDMETILKELGFTVHPDGRVSW